MSKRYKRIILIGRFQPFHRGHLENFKHALTITDKVIILVGSSHQPCTPKNPLTFDAREAMITGSLRDYAHPELFEIYPLQDFKYSNNNWISKVQSIVKNDSPQIADEDIAIMGYDKDESSWYNHAFPSWDFISMKGFVESGSNPIDATKIRELYFEGDLDYINGTVPPFVFRVLQEFKRTDDYKELVNEYNFYKNYHKSWEFAPFVPIFQTTDAVVIQGGHILLIQRGYSPGKGLWALPGGFINPKERLEDSMIRELAEETKIKVPEIVLRKSITHNQVFDHPDRDLRGRTITMAYLIELTGGNGELPKVKGSDDAKHAKWFKLSQVDRMGEYLYGDHQHIIESMVARARS